MLANQRRTLRLVAFLTRTSVALLVAALATGCASMNSLPEVDARPTIAFENAGNEPVRVYLVEVGGGDHLLGSVYPMERTSLRVPAHMSLAESRQLTLMVVPLSRHTGGTLTPAPVKHLSSPTVSSLYEIANFRWVATPASLHYMRGGNVSVVR